MLNSENCQKRILDADYTPLNIEEFPNGQDHLSNLEKEVLMKLLQANSALFEGGLGTMKMDLVSLEKHQQQWLQTIQWQGLSHITYTYDTTTTKKLTD
jgi:hypothetical protein